MNSKKVGSAASLFAVIVGLGLVGCESENVTLDPQRPPTPTVSYSPYVIELDGAPGFSRVSFKDVGVQVKSDAERSLVHESIAEALAAELRSGPASSSVVFSADQTDPRQHLACSLDEMYVDVWGSGEGWGYSLWSGCSMEDRFAVGNVPVVAEDDVTARVIPLAKDIAEHYRAATLRGCYASNC